MVTSIGKNNYRIMMRLLKVGCHVGLKCANDYLMKLSLAVIHMTGRNIYRSSNNSLANSQVNKNKIEDVLLSMLSEWKIVTHGINCYHRHSEIEAALVGKTKCQLWYFSIV